MKPNTAATLALLRTRGAYGVTPLDALGASGSFRLGARVWELKEAGFDIEPVLTTMPSGLCVVLFVLFVSVLLWLGVA